MVRNYLKRWPLLEPRLPGFDETFYAYWYRDTKRFRGGPLQHYLLHGWREGRDPSAGFSTEGYLAANPDIRDKDVNPLLHFLNHGLAEGRRGWERDPAAPAAVPRQRTAREPMKLLAAPRER